MTWQAQLSLRYRHRLDATTGAPHTDATFTHTGPLRVLQALYPDGPAICQHVLVHPPGGLVGGDRLHIHVQADAEAHAVITTPGATRFYRCDPAPSADASRPQAIQHTQLQLAAGARLQWLPHEALAYPGCHALNRIDFDLAPGAQLIGWDATALGLPAAHQAFDAAPFDRGHRTSVYEQHLHWPGHWRERARIRADDTRLLASPVGLGGMRMLATLFWLSADAQSDAQREAALRAARDTFVAQPSQPGRAPSLDGLQTAATSPNPHVVLVRAMAHQAEPAMAALRAVRRAWLYELWGLRGGAADDLRIWRT
jgi:urease accessory protein